MNNTEAQHFKDILLETNGYNNNNGYKTACIYALNYNTAQIIYPSTFFKPTASIYIIKIPAGAIAFSHEGTDAKIIYSWVRNAESDVQHKFIQYRS